MYYGEERERENELKLKLIDKLATSRVTRNIYVYIVYTYLPHCIYIPAAVQRYIMHMTVPTK